MARAPSDTSLEWLLGQEDLDPAPNPLRSLSGPDVDRLIRRCAAALQSHGNDFHHGPDKENALGAFESVIALLLEVRDVYPTKRAGIDPILVRFGYPVLES